jgi:hypothetical protein
VVKPFRGEINLDVRDSVPDWDAFTADKAPQGAPNVLVVLYDDTGCAAWATRSARSIRRSSSSPAGGSSRSCSTWRTTPVNVERELAAAMARD